MPVLVVDGFEVIDIHQKENQVAVIETIVGQSPVRPHRLAASAVIVVRKIGGSEPPSADRSTKLLPVLYLPSQFGAALSDGSLQRSRSRRFAAAATSASPEATAR